MAVTTGSDWLQELRDERTHLGRASTAERVADVLRLHVTAGRLRPGDRLSEESIGGALGVSRNTLREAFRLLTHEGLLVHEFNRGVFVRRLTLDDVRDVYLLRRIIETAALRELADVPVDETRLAEVRAAVEEGEAAARERRWVDVGTANMRFHRAIAGLVGSPRVDELMARLVAELRLVFHVMAAPREFHEPYLETNRRVLALLEAGDARTAQGVLEDYLEAAATQVLAAFERDAGPALGEDPR